MITGITVTLLELNRAGSGPIWVPETVDNVLVAPLSEVDSTVGPLPEGHRALYHLAIPKTDTHRWEGQLVQFWNQTWAVVGIPTEGIEKLIPGPWNKKVAVELYRTGAPDVASLWRDVVQLIARKTVKDASGYEGTDVYEGRDVNAILPYGVTMESTEKDRKDVMQRKLNAEVWDGDYFGETLLGHAGRTYSITKVKDTGRGTVMLECEEVWR